MKTPITISLASCALFAASCTQVTSLERTNARADVTVDDATRETAARETATPREASIASAAQGDRKGPMLSASERAIFQDAAFRRRFVEGYLSETDIEPPLTDDERKNAIQIFDLIGEDKLEEAEEFARSIYSDDASAAIHFTVAHVLVQRGKLKEALKFYESATDKFPKFRRAWAFMSQAAIQAEDFEKATKAASRVIALGGGDGPIWGILGVSHFKLERFVAAESAFRMATALDPDRINWKQGLAECFFAQQRYADAAAMLDPLIQEQRDSAELWLAQGRAYANLGKLQKATENIEVVDALGGADVRTLNLLAGLYAKQDMYEMSVDAFLRAVRKDPKAPVTSALEVARYLIGMNALPEASSLLKGIEEARGDQFEKTERQALLRVRASYAIASGAGEEKHVAILRELIQLDPLDGQALILLGRQLGGQGKTQEAITYFERAAGLDAYRAEALLRHGEVLVRAKKFREALPLLRSTYQLRPREDVKSLLEDIEKYAKTQGGS